ncbi:LOW QUALITY PROTEIN: tRNA-dihydrouridine(47) synthase [NAD(P)(+)]-like [Chroicocephalus ridibundus]|uniref:LOW QUALITY PROTEIN: tRNA-dihydrouridine(47) synthase [NAD(P)(+)]-like n=1 Tax=Chroicocephalus ridibundus TaxID=1192867 RepID=UPI002FDE143B
MAAAASGVAPVRARFLTSKEQFHAYLRARGEPSGGGEEEEEEEEKVKEEEEVGSCQSEPPAKRVKSEDLGQDGESREDVGAAEKEPAERKRARGQNKSRPCMKPKHYEQSRLCPSVTQGCVEKCYFGPRCRFLHDIGEYMAAKPADLGRSCVLFETFGKCIYGITCRFAQAHLGDGYQNIVNTDLAKQWEGKSLVRNNLSKELQHQLRKRKFSFRKADEYLRGLGKPHGDGGKGGKATERSTEEQEVSNCTTAQEGLGEVPECPALPEQGEDPKPDALQSPTTGEEAFSVKTVGPLTDESTSKGILYLVVLPLLEHVPPVLPFCPASSGAFAESRCDFLLQLHGRCREQRYTRGADWDSIAECAKIASPMPLFGNGDILSYEDADRAMQMGVSGIMIARGAFIKPWLFTEIKEQRHWDISSSERFDILKDFTNYGLEHWGSDTQGVEKTRKFLLEWLSFLCRYIPVGLLEHLPQKINERPPYYVGRDYLETLMASQNVDDWIRISELLLGAVPTNFTFLPKHTANSYR